MIQTEKTRPFKDHSWASVLVVDDDEDVCLLLKTQLEQEGFAVQTARNFQSVEKALAHTRFDCVLLDIFLGTENGMSAMPYILNRCPTTKVVVLTASGSIDLAVEAMHQGASNFLTKSAHPKRVVEEIKATLISSGKVAPSASFPDGENYGLIGHSAATREVIDKINRMKNVDATVLLTGESGTGKELVAAALHRGSTRARESFAAINCGAIPENLLESELFGHRKGAFTDAKTDRKGIFEQCSMGTLLLDEVGEMPLSLQVKLLRVLQEREIRPVGGTETIKVNTRVIAATNRSLEEEVRTGRFREDLYYRLTVLRIDLPSLRERREDIPVLAEHFIEKFNERFAKSIAFPGPEILARLMAYHWPGNVRELQNRLERGVILAQDDQLQLANVFDRVDREFTNKPAAPPEIATAPSDVLLPFSQAKQIFEKDYLIRVLRMTKGNVSEASRIAEQHRPRIYRLLKRYSINPDTFKTGNH